MGVERIQLRRGTAAAWTSANPVLALGEPGIETDTGYEKIGDGTSNWNSLAYIRSSPSVENAIPQVTAPLASGDTSGVTDRTNLLAAITSVPVGGRLVIPNPSRNGQTKYMVDQAIVFPQHIQVEGESLVELWASGASGVTNTNGPGAHVSSGTPCYVHADAFAGVVIEQQTAAADVIQCPTAASTVHLKNIAAGFAAAIADANTGHCFNATPTTDYSTKPDDGLMGARWENCIAFGHDGNHYGFLWVNPLLCTDIHCRSYGGGGFLKSCNSALSSYGNHVSVHPYAFVYNAGTAHGYGHSSSSATFPGTLNLITYVRPQAIAHNAVLTAATQGAWNDNALGTGVDPTGISALSADLENFAANSNHYISPNTRFSGHGLVSIAYGPFNDYLFNESQGFQALGKITTGADHTAVGYQASASVSANSGTTAVGYQALKANTNPANTAVGYKAATAITNASSRTTAIGYQALVALTSGSDNTALGDSTLAALVTGGSSTALGSGALKAATSGGNTAVGASAMTAATSASGTTALGLSAAAAVTTGVNSVYIGQNAGYKPAGTLANASVLGSSNTFVGYQTGVNSAGDYSNGTALGHQALVNGNYATALGKGTVAGAAGAVAIGVDHLGTSASTTTQDVIALGTVNHQVQISNNATGAGSAALGANCPAVTATAPYTWLKLMSSDGSTVYAPVWK